MRANKVKQQWREGQPSVGSWIALGNPLATEILAHVGFDWLTVDTEHNAIDLELTQTLFQVMATTDTVPFVRVPWNDPQRDIETKLRFQPELLRVGLLGERLVACVMVGYEGHRGWINYLAVTPELRKHGLGRRMMEEAETRLRALGCPKINLQIRSQNKDVIAFYGRLGYKLEDVVSMGTVSARMTRRVLPLAWKILAIETLALVQAADLRKREGKEVMGSDFARLHDRVREISWEIGEDRPLFEDHNHMAAAVKRCELLGAVESEIGALDSSW